MRTAPKKITPREFAASLAEKAVECQGATPTVAAYSAEATLRFLQRQPDASGRRAESYFNTVLRRRLLRGHAGVSAAARLVVDAVVSDLLNTGRTPREAYQEIARGWGDKLPADVIEEYREQLCA